MENYSSNIDRYRIIISLLVVSVIFSFLFNEYIYPNIVLITSDFSLKYPDLMKTLSFFDFAIEPVSFLAIYSILWLLYDRFLWKLKKFQFFEINNMPDLNGVWEGTLCSTYKKNDGDCFTERFLEMHVYQNYSKMKIQCKFFNQSKDVCTSYSESTLAGVFDMETKVVLKFAFENTSKQLDTQSKHYYGYNELNCSIKDNSMSGFYFTGRDTGQHNGTIELKKKILKK